MGEDEEELALRAARAPHASCGNGYGARISNAGQFQCTIEFRWTSSRGAEAELGLRRARRPASESSQNQGGNQAIRRGAKSDKGQFGSTGRQTSRQGTPGARHAFWE